MKQIPAAPRTFFHSGFVNVQTFWEHFGWKIPGKRTPQKGVRDTWRNGCKGIETGLQTSAPLAPRTFVGNVEQVTGDHREGIDSAEVQAEGPPLGFGGTCRKEENRRPKLGACVWCAEGSVLTCTSPGAGDGPCPFHSHSFRHGWTGLDTTVV